MDRRFSSPAIPRIVASASPLYLRGSRPEAVLLLHGWTGYPGQLYYLARRLHAVGFTVSLPRLPGHGTNGSDLVASSERDWLRRAEDGYLDLTAEYTQIIAIGISMGALLALHLGAVMNPAALVLAAPALAVRARGARLAPLLHRIVPEIKVPLERRDLEPDEKFIRDEYWATRRLKSIADLLRLQRRIRREIPAVGTPMLVLETRADELVVQGAAERLKRRVASTDFSSRLFEESRHQMFNGSEREAVADEVLRWLAARIPDG